MHVMYERLKDMLCAELEKIVNKGEITPTNLEYIDRLTHSVKSIDAILAMDDSGYSNRDYSYARNRDSRGRYSREESYDSRGGYSGRNEMYSRLSNMADEARSDQEREMIRGWMKQLDK